MEMARKKSDTYIPNYPIPVIDDNQDFIPGEHPVQFHDDKDYSLSWWRQLTLPSIGYVLVISEEWHDKEEVKKRGEREGVTKDKRDSRELDGSKEPIAYLIFGSLNAFQKAYYSLLGGDTFWNQVLRPSENWYRVIGYYMTKGHKRHQYNDNSIYPPFYFKMTERGKEDVA